MWGVYIGAGFNLLGSVAVIIAARRVRAHALRAQAHARRASMAAARAAAAALLARSAAGRSEGHAARTRHLHGEAKIASIVAAGAVAELILIQDPRTARRRT
jgi:hypothetical protein